MKKMLLVRTNKVATCTFVFDRIDTTIGTADNAVIATTWAFKCGTSGVIDNSFLT